MGFRLLTKFGEKGVINLGKAIPLIRGIVGATFDSVATNTIGNVARHVHCRLTLTKKRRGAGANAPPTVAQSSAFC